MSFQNSFGSGGFGSNPSSGFGGQSIFGSNQPGAFSGAFSFGQSNAPAQQVIGTTVKFQSVSGTDTINKNGTQTNINTLHQCITSMKEYESKSLEELRYEDYNAKRKFPTTAPTASTGTFQTSLFGGSAPSSTTGLFGATSTSTFGSTTQNTGLFGSNKPLFGTTGTTSTTTGLFGASSTLQNQPTSAVTANKGFSFGPSAPQTSSPSTGLFGSSGATNIFGQPSTQTTSNVFGATNPVSTTTSGLFGQTSTGFPSSTTTTTTGFGQTTQNKPLFGTSTFSTTPSTTTQPSGGLFGTTTTTSPFSTQSTLNKQTSFGTPFGSQTPTATATTTGFGATTQKSPFGATTSSNVFGGFGQQNTPTTSFASGFGTQPSNALQPTTTTTTGFGFGSGLSASTTTQPSFGLGATSSAFGTTPQQSTGLTNPFSSIGGTTTSQPLGQPSSTTGSFFGSTTQFNPLGTTQTTQMPNLSSTIISPTSAQQQPQYVQQQLLALSNSPYGTSPLFRNLTDFNKSEEILKPVNPTAQKLFMTDTTNLIKGGLSQSVKLTPKPISLTNISKSQSLFEGLEEEEEVPCFVPRKNLKKLLFKSDSSRRSSTSNSINSEKIDFLSDTQNNRNDMLNSPFDDAGKVKNLNYLPNKNKDNKTPYLDYSVKDQINNDYANISEDGNEDRNNEINDVQESEDGDRKHSHPANIILERPDYFLIPSMEELATMVDEEGNCYVENFSIGRTDYGCITFFGITNVANLNLDEIVIIRSKEVIVYPDDTKKPPVGQGLNKPAEITIHRIWPIDKQTKLFITDQEKIFEMNYHKLIEKRTNQMGAEFVDYDTKTGSWTFKVKHFSKYGLHDSEDEDNSTDYKNENFKERLKQQKKIIELRRLELQKKNTNNLKWNFNDQDIQINGQNKINLNIDDIEDDSDYNNKDDNSIYPDLTNYKYNYKNKKLYPTLINNDLDDKHKQDDLIANNDDYEALDHDNELISDNMYMKQDNNSFDFDKNSDYIITNNNLAPLINNNSNNMNTNYEFRNKQKLLNAFFNTNDYDHDDNNKIDVDYHDVDGDNDNEKRVIDKINKNRLYLGTYGLDGNLKKLNKSFDSDKIDEKKDDNNYLSIKPKLLVPATTANNEFDIKRIKKFKLNGYFKTNAYLKTKLLTSYKCPKQYIKSNESIISKKSSYLADLRLFNSRMFKVNWFNLSSSYTCLFRDDTDSVLNTNLYLKLNSLNYGCIDNYKLVESCESYLNVQLDNSDMLFDAKISQIPLIKPNIGNKIISDFKNLTNQILENNGQHLNSYNLQHYQHVYAVWSLCESLWGDIEEINDDKMTIKQTNSDYEINKLRKLKLTKWLSNMSKIENELKLINNMNDNNAYLNTIFSLLSVNRLLDACAKAIEFNDYRLALLLSQLTTNKSLRKMINKQLNEWNTSETDQFIAEQRLKLYLLLSGELTFNFKKTKLNINICDNLDWKRQFSVILWYICQPHQYINDALGLYEKYLKEKSCSNPNPPYIEDNNNENNNKKNEIFDTCYHLIKLFCDKTYELNKILSPECHTDNLLDFRLSWHLLMCLMSLGYKHISEHCVNIIHDSYASQLEAIGLWNWSIFILLHINNEKQRETIIKLYLNKNVTSDKKLNDKEKFANEKLKIPLEWIYEAKSIKAKYENNHFCEAYNLIKAKKWNDAHLIIKNYIGPECIMKDELKLLSELLEPLSKEHVNINNWISAGYIYLKYIKLNDLYNGKYESNSDQSIFNNEDITYLAELISNFECDNNSKKKHACIKICKLLLKLFYMFIQSNNDSNTNINEKCNKFVEQIPEHKIIETMKMYRFKYQSTII